MKTESPARSRENSDVRRPAIAAAARALIAERGFEGLRTRDIAERVGINVATLHYHVPTKEALIEIVAQSMRDDFIAQSKAWRREGLTPLQELQQEMADFRHTMEHNPELFAVLAEMVERARRDPKVDAAVRPLQAYWHQQIVDILTRGRRDGSFRPDLDPRAAAVVITGAMVATQRPPFQGVSQFDRVAAELLRAFLNPVSSR
jgi:AcrR family transcriptional regulator